MDLDNSQNDNTTGLLFHWREHWEILLHCRLLPCEYALFRQFLVMQADGPRLLDAFQEVLFSEFNNGRYPSFPLDAPGESLPYFPAQDHGDSDSSVEDIWEDMWDEESDHGALQVDELVDAVAGAGVGQGDAGGPAGYEVVVRVLAEDVADTSGHSVNGGEVSDDATFGMEPLF